MDDNYQGHRAHRKGDDGERGPAGVVGRVRGAVFGTPALQRVFHVTRSGRTPDRADYVRCRRWHLYAAQPPLGEAVAVWVYGERLTLALSDEPLAQYTEPLAHYTVAYRPDKTAPQDGDRGAAVRDAASRPQQPLWDLGDGEWLRVLRLPDSARAPRARATTGS